MTTSRSCFGPAFPAIHSGCPLQGSSPILPRPPPLTLPRSSLPSQLLQTRHHSVLHPPLPSEGQQIEGCHRNSSQFSTLEHDLQLDRPSFRLSISEPQLQRHDGRLVSNYTRLGAIADARRVFDCLPSPDVAAYSALISAHAKAGQETEAVDLFTEMCMSGIEPNEFALVAVLTACIRLCCFILGTQIHALAIKTGYIGYIYVANAMMAAYTKCNHVAAAVQLFGEMPQRDVVSFNTIISGLVQDLEFVRAFELFRSMQSDGLRADQFSLSCLLTATSELQVRALGQEIHGQALRTGLHSNLSVNNALIRFYTKCGTIEDVVSVFEGMPIRDVISWTEVICGYMEFGLVESAVSIFHHMPERNGVSYNALLSGFCQNVEGSDALELFCEMLEDGIELSDFTLTSVINACAMLSDIKNSKQIHAFVLKVGLGSNYVIEAALLDMCTKCGRLDDAKKMLDRWTDESSRSIAWTSMICGFARHGQPEQAMALFCEGGVFVDEVSLATILGVCGTLGFANNGKQLHAYSLKSGLLTADLAVGNAAVNMYSKCGFQEDAIKLFNLLPRHDTVSWNTLIASYVLHRRGDEALNAWTKMRKFGIKPDSISFLQILSAFRRASKPDSMYACKRLFKSMSSQGIEPTSEHYASMVHAFGYWGHLKEAEELIDNMPFKPDAVVWRALLDSCRLRSNASLGKRAAQQLLALQPDEPSLYILIANLYSASGRWHCSERVREEMKERGLHKHPARSWTIHENKIHTFYARDRSHPQAKDVYSGLEILILQNMKVGYVPDTRFVLHEVEEYQKKDFLMYHSAKLAATYGLLMAKPGKPVRVMKNIHLCGDCHEFLKCSSITTRREITVRDATGFHCFRDGECSCGDYW